eukprot:599975-Pelagomonas_calceolata.AAC.10
MTTSRTHHTVWSRPICCRCCCCCCCCLQAKQRAAFAETELARATGLSESRARAAEKRAADAAAALERAERKAAAADAELESANNMSEARAVAAEKRAADATAALNQARQRAAAAEAELQQSVPAAESRAKAAEKRAADALAALQRAEQRAAAASRELEVADSEAERRAAAAERRAADAVAALAQVGTGKGRKGRERLNSCDGHRWGQKRTGKEGWTSPGKDNKGNKRKEKRREDCVGHKGRVHSGSFAYPNLQASKGLTIALRTQAQQEQSRGPISYRSSYERA